MIPTLLHYSLIVLIVILGMSLCFLLNTYRNVTFRSDALQRRTKWIQGGLYGAISSMSLLLIAYGWFAHDPTELRGTWFWRSQLLVVISLAVLSLVWITVPQSSIKLEEPEYQDSLAVIRYLSYSILALCVGWMGWSVYQYVLDYRRKNPVVPIPPDSVSEKVYYPVSMRDHYYYRPELNPDLQMKLVSELQTKYKLPKEFSKYYVELVDGNPDLDYNAIVKWSIGTAFLARPNETEVWHWIDESDYTIHTLSKYNTKNQLADDIRRGEYIVNNKLINRADDNDHIINMFISQLELMGIKDEDQQFLIMMLSQQGQLANVVNKSVSLFFPSEIFYSGFSPEDSIFFGVSGQVDGSFFPSYALSFFDKKLWNIYCTINSISNKSIIITLKTYGSFLLNVSKIDSSLSYLGVAIIESVIYFDIVQKKLYRFYRIVKWSSDAIRDLMIAIYNVGKTAHQVLPDTMYEMFRHVSLKEMYDTYRDSFQADLVRQYKKVLYDYTSDKQLEKIKRINSQLPDEIREQAKPPRSLDTI